MRLLISLTGLLLALKASAVSNFSRALQVEARTSNGVETYTVTLDYEKGFVYTDIDSQDIQQARIANIPRYEKIGCRFVDQSARQANWLSDEFGARKTLRTPFPRATGMICYLPDPDIVRIAVDPPMFGERVLNIRLPQDPFGRVRRKTEATYEDRGEFATLNKATVLDTMRDTISVDIKHADNLYAMYDMHNINDEITRPLTRITEFWVRQERYPYNRNRPNRSKS